LTNRGPVRVGIFAANSNNTGRVSSGASCYGIMELSGNLAEQAVSIGNGSERSFTGAHGDGMLSGNSNNVLNWPFAALGNGPSVRGSYWGDQPIFLRVSNRTTGTT